jgi:hypothetical protein
MEFVAALHVPKHGPGNTHHYNTVATPTTFNSAEECVSAARDTLAMVSRCGSAIESRARRVIPLIRALG